MRIFLIAALVLVLSFFTYAQPAPVTYTVDNKNITLPGKKYKSGYGVHMEFYPWTRAVREAELGKADILFPEYFISDDVMSENTLTKTRNQLLALSEPIPSGDLSFVAL
ncbi:MAG: hypothetical protein R3203_13460 [Pseudoalteromonas tetraodonis]|nr:hypothetical protein [Pseudoalteromonas tetraodonis]